VSDPAESPAPADSVLVEFPATEGYRGVGRLVLGGLASRFELPVDRVEDLLLAVESLLMHGVVGDTVMLEVEAGDDGLRVRLGPFADGAVRDPAVARVVTTLVDEAHETPSENGDGAFAELLVSAARHRRAG
jgi:hypothetical protein